MCLLGIRRSWPVSEILHIVASHQTIIPKMDLWGSPRRSQRSPPAFYCNMGLRWRDSSSFPVLLTVLPPNRKWSINRRWIQIFNGPLKLSLGKLALDQKLPSKWGQSLETGKNPGWRTDMCTLEIFTSFRMPLWTEEFSFVMLNSMHFKN